MKDSKPYGNLGLALGLAMFHQGVARRSTTPPKPKVLSEVEAWNKAVDQAKAEKKAARLLKARLK